MKSKKNAPGAIRALWVECESSASPYLSWENGERLIVLAERAAVSDVFLQVYKGGREYFSPGSGQAALLSRLLSSLQAQRVRVHGWLNIFNLGVSPPTGCLIDLPLTEDNSGAGVASYLNGSRREYLLDTPGYWLDPAGRAARGWVWGVVARLLEACPTLNGVHLDYFRYPYLMPVKPASFSTTGYDFGYTEEARAEFSRDTGLAAPFKEEQGRLVPNSYQTSLEWDEWRRTRLAGCLEDIRAVMQTGQVLSLAAIPWFDRSYLCAFQDWPSWIESGLLDTVALMSYTGDTRLFDRLLRQALALVPARRLLAGIGLYRLGDPSALREELACAARHGVDWAIFSHGALSQRGEFADVLME